MNFRQKSLADNKGMVDAFGLAAGAIMIAVGVTVLFIGILLKSEVSSAIDRSGFSYAENTTFSDISDNADVAFTLLGVGLIVAGAAMIVNIVRMAM